MAYVTKQLRFYGDGDNINGKNYPLGVISNENLVSGSIFQPYLPIYAIGISTIPGIHFYLNTSKISTTVGHSGLFELDTTANVIINSLNFERETLESLVSQNPNGYLIIDLLYDDGRKEV